MEALEETLKIFITMTKLKGKISLRSRQKYMKIMKHLGEAYPSCMYTCKGVKKILGDQALSVTPQIKPSSLYPQIWLNSSVNCLSSTQSEIA